MTEAARLVDELTTLLYEVVKRWRLQDGRVCEIVVCGACRRKADSAESVVHDSHCPVYRLIRAEEANTAVIRANAEQIADLEDKRDELEAKVNALTAEMECRNELASRSARLDALAAERDAAVARAERADALLARAERNASALEGVALNALSSAQQTYDKLVRMSWRSEVRLAQRAALAAASEGSSLVTTRTITMRCHCGRGVTIGPDPWCEGCVQSAATCDCVPATQGEG